MRHNEIPILSHPLQINFWRPPTDNDLGFANMRPELLWMVHRNPYKKMTYSPPKATRLIVNRSADNLIVIAVFQEKAFKKLVVQYEINGLGEVQIKTTAIPKKDLIRLGFTTELEPGFSEVEWFGRGPHETYCDRKTAAAFGRYESDVDLLAHDYMRPQENGLRTDVYELSLRSENGLLNIIGDHHLLSFSIWPYGMTTLEEAKHGYELKNQCSRTLNIDGYHKGVGGDTPGDLSLLEPYTLPKDETYIYRMKLSYKEHTK
jgi:beta-galactosidase